MPESDEMLALLEERRQQLNEICQQYRVRRLEVFGSAATEEQFDPDRSDLDLLVDFEPDQELGPWLKHYFDFQQELQTLFGRPIDLVMASALKHPAFIREVNRTRKAVYGR